MDKLFDVDIPTLKFKPVDVESISLIVCSLHVWKASGADGLPTKFVKTTPFEQESPFQMPFTQKSIKVIVQ